MFLYVQYVLKIIKQKIAHPYQDCNPYSREGKLQGLHLHLRGLGNLGTQIRIKNHPHNLPATIHPSLNNNNIHGTGQIGLHKMFLLNLGTRDGETRILEITNNNNMQYQFSRIHVLSILQTYISYCLDLLHLLYHPFNKLLNSFIIHLVPPFFPLNPFQILAIDHLCHSIMLIFKITQLTP
jgi:hypothetical protein